MFQTVTSTRGVAWLLLGLMWCGATAHAQVPFVPTPPAPGAKVVWDHEGGAERYELLIDGVRADTRWQADVPQHGYILPLPTLLPGLRTIMVSACNGDACAYSDALIVIAVPGPILMAPPMVQTPIRPPK